MDINKKLVKWSGLFSGSISLGINLVFYFNPTFVDSGVLATLMLIHLFSAFLAFVLGILSIRYWQGILTLILVTASVYLSFAIEVGIH